MVNQQTLENMFSDVESAHEINVLTDNEVVILFQDHGADDIEDYFYNTSTPTIESALAWLGYPSFN